MSTQDEKHATIWRWFRDRMVRGDTSEPAALLRLQERLEESGRELPTEEEMDEAFWEAVIEEGRP